MSYWQLYYYDGTAAAVDGLGTLEHAIAHMRRMLPLPGRSHVGLVDAKGTAMQFAGRPSGLVRMEIVCLERGGSWCAELELEECCRRVEQLGAQIDRTNYPDLCFIRWGC